MVFCAGRGAWVAAGMLVLGAGAATAQSAPPLDLPTLALEPAPAPSIWHGLTVGTELVAVSSRSGGGIGGDVFAGYDHAFANGIVLGVRGSTGYLPGWGRGGLVKGYDFAGTEVKVGYDMGRLMPFVTAGVALARPHLGAGLGTPGSDSLNLVLNGAGETHTLTNVGAGVEYAVTNDLTIGIAVNAIQRRGPILLP